MLSTQEYREWLEEFIQMYRSEISLWKLKSREYQNRKLKDAGYEKLIKKLREKEPEADREAVLKKINSLRCTYRKELKKVIASKCQTSGVETYEPKLWYFHLFRFLDNQEEPKTDAAESVMAPNEMEDTASEPDKSYLNDIPSTTTKPQSAATPSSSHKDILAASSRSFVGSTSSSQMDAPTSTSRTNTPTSLKRNFNEVFPEESISSQEKEENYYDLYGKMISMKFRRINGVQKLLAEKIINEVLFDAQLGNLSIEHKLVNTAVSRNNVDNLQMTCSPMVYNYQVPEQKQVVGIKIDEDCVEEFESFGG